MSGKSTKMNARDVLEFAIGRMIRRLKTRRILSSGILGVSGLLAATLALVAADHALYRGLPDWLTWPATLTIAVAVAAIEGILVHRAVARRWNAAYAAWQIERFLGGTHNTVINAVMLRDATSSASVADTVLVAAAAACEQSPVEPRPVANRPERLAPIALSVALLAWLVFILATPKSVTQSLARIAGADLPAPTMTRLTWISPGIDEGVYAGDPLLIRVKQSGHAADSVECSVTPISMTDPADSLPAPMSREFGEPGAWRCLIAAHETVVDFRVTCTSGDARIERVFAVRPKPRVMHYQMTIRPPVYTALPVRVSDDPDISAPAGSDIEIAITANVEIRNPVLVFSSPDESRSRMTVSTDDGHRAMVLFRPRHSGRFHVQFADPWGRAASNTTPHAIYLVDDEPPSLRLAQPDESKRAPEGIDLDFTTDAVAEASDDYGISEITFVVALADGRTVSLPVAMPPAADSQRSVLARTRIVDAPIPPGSAATAWFEAADNRVLPDGTFAPQRAQSEKLLLHRPSPSDLRHPDSFGPSESLRDSSQTEPGLESASPSTGNKSPRKNSRGGADANPESHRREQRAAADAPTESGDPVADFRRTHARSLEQLERRLADSPLDQPAPLENGFPNIGESGDKHNAGIGKKDATSGDALGSDSSNESRTFGDGQSGKSAKLPDDQRASDRCLDRPVPNESREASHENPPAETLQGSVTSSGDRNSSELTDSSEESAPSRRQSTSNPGEESPLTRSPGQSNGDSQESDVHEPNSARRGDEKTDPNEHAKPERGDSGHGTSDTGEKRQSAPPIPEARTGPDDLERDSSVSTDNSGDPVSDQEEIASGTGKGNATVRSATHEKADSPERSGDLSSSAGGSDILPKNDSKSPPADGESTNVPSQDGSEVVTGNRDTDPRRQPGRIPGRGIDDQPTDRGPGIPPDDSPASQPAAFPAIDSEVRDSPHESNLATDGRVERVDVLDRLLRMGGVTPELANELGWSTSQTDQFNRELGRLAESGQYLSPSSEPLRVNFERRIEPESVLPAIGGQEDLDFESGKRRQFDKRRSISPPSDQRVSSDLSQLLAEYYRSMSYRETSKKAP